MDPEDWSTVAAIYEAGIATGNATFETSTPSWDAWDAAHRTELRFVAIEDTAVVGWVAAGNVSDRCCYEGVVEHSVYVSPERQGVGIGAVLLTVLVTATEQIGVWTIQSGIFPRASRV